MSIIIMWWIWKMIIVDVTNNIFMKCYIKAQQRWWWRWCLWETKRKSNKHINHIYVNLIKWSIVTYYLKILWPLTLYFPYAKFSNSPVKKRAIKINFLHNIIAYKRRQYIVRLLFVKIVFLKSTPPKGKTELNFINNLIKKNQEVEVLQLNVRKIWGRNVLSLTQFSKKTPVCDCDYWHFWIKNIFPFFESPIFGLSIIKNSQER